MKSDWVVERHENGVDALHALGVPDDPVRTLRWCVPERKALVIGSAQRESDVDAKALQNAGYELVRRKSGGGAVLVKPNATLWCDVVLPAHDELWNDDVGKAFHWLGHTFANALHALGHENVRVHEGALVTNKWSRSVCFAGVGPGECTIDDKKVVGISQRRSRAGALFQCALHTAFDPTTLPSLLDLTDVQKAELSGYLRTSVAAVPSVDERTLEKALLDALP